MWRPARRFLGEPLYAVSSWFSYYAPGGVIVARGRLRSRGASGRGGAQPLRERFHPAHGREERRARRRSRRSAARGTALRADSKNERAAWRGGVPASARFDEPPKEPKRASPQEGLCEQRRIEAGAKSPQPQGRATVAKRRHLARLCGRPQTTRRGARATRSDGRAPARAAHGSRRIKASR